MFVWCLFSVFILLYLLVGVSYAFAERLVIVRTVIALLLCRVSFVCDSCLIALSLIVACFSFLIGVCSALNSIFMWCLFRLSWALLGLGLVFNLLLISF